MANGYKIFEYEIRIEIFPGGGYAVDNRRLEAKPFKLMKITQDIKERVEKHLKKHECAVGIEWSEDEGYCTTIDADGNDIETFMIDVDEEGVWYTSVENWQHTLPIE